MAVAMLAAVLVGCSAGKGSQPSQVVARVDDSEITVSQWSEALLARPDAAAAPQASRQVIDGLINEQLLLNQALSSGLDRDPAVVQALEHARREVLARAYTERMIFPREPVSAAEQIEYYKKHPELFEKRKVYQVVAYTVRADDLSAAIRNQLVHAGSPDAVRDALSGHNLAFEAQGLTRAAEQLPLESLGEFAAAAVGDLLIMPPRNGQTVMMLLTGVQDSPIDLERAQPIIQQYLLNVRNAQALDERLKQMRATAKITYVADLSDSASRLAAGASPSAPAEQRVRGAAAGAVPN
jgi:EpsD family peptidyl-prolyl cis-trans isomerase